MTKFMVNVELTLNEALLLMQEVAHIARVLATSDLRQRIEQGIMRAHRDALVPNAFTQCPWWAEHGEVRGRPNGEVVTLAKCFGGETHGPLSGHHGVNAHANAMLMAAAPGLLRDCREFVRCMDRDFSDQTYGHLFEAAQQARESIAKATAVMPTAEDQE